MTHDVPLVHTPQLDEAGRRLVERHRAWWGRQGSLFADHTGSPLGDLWLPLADGTLATEDLTVTPEILDVERLAGADTWVGPEGEGGAAQPGHGALQVEGDVFAARAPYARVPWVEAILGCPIRATIVGGSMRTQAFMPSWEAWENRPIKRHEGWFDLLKRLVERMVARSGGRYAVVQTLMRGPTDLAEAVFGPEMMCLSLYDHPEELRRFLDEATELFIEILHAQLERIPRVEGGYVDAFGVWAPGTVVRTQCDASAILSPRQYAEWFLPYDERICRSVDRATIHLHSSSLHTVDALVQVEPLHAIQVTWETAGPTVPTFERALGIYRKVLEHKALILSGPITDAELAVLQRELPQDGLYIGVRRNAW
jgi:hypothetical protein